MGNPDILFLMEYFTQILASWAAFYVIAAWNSDQYGLYRPTLRLVAVGVTYTDHFKDFWIYDIFEEERIYQ